jgi:hypothetical protein
MAAFQPNRNGTITMMEFCKSIDTVYKELRKLRASISNEGKMNAAAEKVINYILNFLLVCGALVAVRVNPMTIFGIMLHSHVVLVWLPLICSGDSSSFWFNVVSALLLMVFGVLAFE